MEKVDEDASLEFKWLKKKGVGGKNKKIQFYESFIYDGVKYALYDCVYMYKEGLQEPYIGKLTKIWECSDKTKKVKVHWFFRPEEISNWIGNTMILENEILFASNEGHGLANVNTLEAIAGPCNVVCISKDIRNPQPSDEEIKVADFIFYRTFDVKSFTILDAMGEEVGGLQIKDVFNRKEGESITPVPERTSDRKEVNPNTATSGEQQQLTITVPNKLKDDEKGESCDKDISSSLKRIISSSSGSDKLQYLPLKKLKSDDKKPPKETPVGLEVTRDTERLTDMPSKKSNVDNSSKFSIDGKSKHEDKLPLDVSNLKHVGTSGTNSEKGKTDKADKVNTVPVNMVEIKERNKTPTGSDKLFDHPFKKMKSDDKKPLKEKEADLEVTRDSEILKDTSSKKLMVDSKSAKHKDKLPVDVNNLKASITSGTTDYRKNEKISAKVMDDVEEKIVKKKRDDSLFKIPDSKKLGINKNGGNGKDLVANSSLSLSKGKINFGVAVGSNKEEAKEEQSGDDECKRKQLTMNSKSLKVSAALSTEKDKKTAYQEFVCCPKPNAEKSGWFRRLPWEERLKTAYDQGTAILLHNVDPFYTSAEVEDIIWHAFNENCEAKMLQRTEVSSPHYAQALILLKTKEATLKILTKLDEECLMLSNGRLLVGTPCPPISTKKNSNFFGHLVVDKIRFQNLREMEEAVSTSHFSQPNTIEYDMAMEWCVLQSRSNKWWDKFHKQQGSELNKLVANLKK